MVKKKVKGQGKGDNKKPLYKCEMCDFTTNVSQSFAGHHNIHRASKSAIKKNSTKTTSKTKKKDSKKAKRKEKNKDDDTKEEISDIKLSESKKDNIDTDIVINEIDDDMGNNVASVTQNQDEYFSSFLETNDHHNNDGQPNFPKNNFMFDDDVQFHDVSIPQTKSPTDDHDNDGMDIDVSDTTIIRNEDEGSTAESAQNDSDNDADYHTMSHDSGEDVTGSLSVDESISSNGIYAKLESNDYLNEDREEYSIPPEITLRIGTIKERRFACKPFQLIETVRIKTMMKQNHEWMSIRGNDIYHDTLEKQPDIFQPLFGETRSPKKSSRSNATNSSSALFAGNEENENGASLKRKRPKSKDKEKTDAHIMSIRDEEKQFYISTAYRIQNDYNKFILDENLMPLLIEDPMFVLRRFPNMCWGLKFIDVFKFFKIKETYSKFTNVLKDHKLVFLLRRLYPKLEKAEIQLKEDIKRDELIIKQQRAEYEKIKAQKAAEKKMKDKKSKAQVRNDEDMNKNADSEDNDDEEENNENKEIGKNQQKPKKKESNEDDTNVDIHEDSKFWLEIIFPRTVDDFKMYKKKLIHYQMNRTIPIVLLPFFLESLFLTKRSDNPPSVVSYDMVDILKKYRDELISTRVYEPNSIQISCLDLTISQLNINVRKYLYYQNGIANDEEYLTRDMMKHLQEKINKLEKDNEKQKRKLAATNKRLKHIEKEYKGRSKYDDDEATNVDDESSNDDENKKEEEEEEDIKVKKIYTKSKTKRDNDKKTKLKQSSKTESIDKKETNIRKTKNNNKTDKKYKKRQ